MKRKGVAPPPEFLQSALKKVTVGKVGLVLIWLLMTFILFLVYVMICSEGLRVLSPMFGMRVHKFPLPFVHHMARSHGWDRLDAGHLTSLLLFGVTSFATHLLCAIFKVTEQTHEPLSTHKKIMLSVASSVVIGDILIFYFGATSRSLFGGSGGFSLSMAILSFFYGLTLICVAMLGEHTFKISEKI